MAFDWNTWAQGINAQNVARGQTGIKYALNRPTASGGSESYMDPQLTFENPAFKAKYIAGLGKPTEAGATTWSSAQPNTAFWSPTGSDWQQLTEASLSNPAAAQAVMRGSAGGPSAGAFGALAQKIPAGVRQGIEGSSNSLAPAVLAKMWKG